MEMEEIIYIRDRAGWRAWLKKNYGNKKGIWLIFYKKHSGKPSIPYDDAVEEALCFGWIDSTVKKIDDERYAQRFTPRSKRSRWSESNIRRANDMIDRGLMTEHGMSLFKNRKSG